MARRNQERKKESTVSSKESERKMSEQPIDYGPAALLDIPGMDEVTVRELARLTGKMRSAIRKMNQEGVPDGNVYRELALLRVESRSAFLHRYLR